MADTTQTRRKRILVSVTNKSGLEKLKPLYDAGWEFVSTGGTAKVLEVLGIKVTSIEAVTGFPEMMDGRLKTLHPKVFGGILADRNKPSHLEAIAAHGIELFDVVVVNLYDFAGKPDIEQIDIGGPSLIRAAAKNGLHTVPVIDPRDYEWIVETLLLGNNVSVRGREGLVAKVFLFTGNYDLNIFMWMFHRADQEKSFLIPVPTAGGH